MLGLMELLELRLRLARCASGSAGWSPVYFANMFRMSVREMTPVSLPDIRAPAMAEAGTAALGTGEAGGPPPDALETLPPVGAASGVAGWAGDLDSSSTTHMR